MVSTTTTVLSIISAVLGLLKWLVGISQQRGWMDAGAAQAALKGIEGADEAINEARQARQAVHDKHVRDPDSILRDDDGHKRPD